MIQSFLILITSLNLPKFYYAQTNAQVFVLKTKINHHHISVMQLGHMLTRSGLTYPEVSVKVYHDSFCPLRNSVSLQWVIYFEAFYLHVVSNFSCIPVICPTLVLFLAPLKFVHLFCNLSKCNRNLH